MPLTKPDLWKSIEDLRHWQLRRSVALRRAAPRKRTAGTAPYTAGVIREYKCFIYALCVSGEALSPSPDVDKAWHLHLIHTKDYWRHFCRVLGQEIHHQPFAEEDSDERHRRNQRRAMDILAAEFDEVTSTAIWSLNPRPVSLRLPGCWSQSPIRHSPSSSHSRRRRSAGLRAWGSSFVAPRLAATGTGFLSVRLPVRLLGRVCRQGKADGGAGCGDAGSDGDGGCGGGD